MQNAFFDSLGKLKEEGRLGMPIREHPYTAIDALGQSLTRNGAVLGNDDKSLGRMLSLAGDAYESFSKAHKDFETEATARLIIPLQRFLSGDVQNAYATRKRAHKARLELDTLKGNAARTAIVDGQQHAISVNQLELAQHYFDDCVIQAMDAMRHVIESTDLQGCLLDFLHAQMLLLRCGHDTFSNLLNQIGA